GRREATVVFLEDLHWAEPTLLELVERLCDAIRDSPLLVVCLARPELLEHRPTWAGGKVSSTTLLLEPLSEQESLELSALRRGPAPEDELLGRLTRKELLERTGGGSFRFRHGTIREVAYATLPKRDRARLHEALADWLDREERDAGVPTDEAVAYHLEQALEL